MLSYLLRDSVLDEFYSAAVEDLVGALLPGSNFAIVLAKHVGKAFLHCVANDPRKVDAVAGAQFSEAWGSAAAKVHGLDLPEDQKLSLLKYLAAVPMSSRQALLRWNDGGHVTTLVSQLPRTIDDVRRFLPIRPPHFQPGHRIVGHDLQLEVLLGQGGFAEVWKAHNTEFRSRPPVALKFCLDEELLPSLRREIEVLDRLKDDEPGKDFVRLLQTAYSADPPFLIYEYIDGGDIAGWVKSFDGKAPGESSVVSVLKMTARAVAVAHDSGVVHRDLKPSNLLMTRSGRVKVADFGIGAVVSEFEASKAGGKSDLSGAHTPMYADPMRDRWARPDPQDDVYAIGVLACQLLMGDVSFQMKGSWQRQLRERNASAGLIDIVETCVAPPGQRFSDAGALLAALEQEPAGAAKRDTPRQARKAAESPKPKFCHMCGKPSARSNLYCNACGYQFP